MDRDPSYLIFADYAMLIEHCVFRDNSFTTYQIEFDMRPDISNCVFSVEPTHLPDGADYTVDPDVTPRPLLLGNAEDCPTRIQTVTAVFTESVPVAATNSFLSTHVFGMSSENSISAAYDATDRVLGSLAGGDSGGLVPSSSGEDSMGLRRSGGFSESGVPANTGEMTGSDSLDFGRLGGSGMMQFTPALVAPFVKRKIVMTVYFLFFS
jgi:hypothetical protein